LTKLSEDLNSMIMILRISITMSMLLLELKHNLWILKQQMEILLLRRLYLWLLRIITHYQLELYSSLQYTMLRQCLLMKVQFTGVFLHLEPVIKEFIILTGQLHILNSMELTLTNMMSLVELW
jgi:hypothetical protein